MLLNYIQRFLDALLFSNVFIACCAVAQGGLTYHLLRLPLDYSVLAILGCATLAMYNFSMILAKPPHPETSSYRRVRWIFSHERSLWVWTSVALLICGVLGLLLHTPSFVLLGVIGLMGVGYNVPFMRTKASDRRTGLRQITGLKVFYIGLVWSLSTVLLPVAEAYHDGLALDWPRVWSLLVWAFLFVVAITIPFDIRDIYQDRYYGLKTIPILVGQRGALVLAAVVLLVQGAWVWVSGLVWQDRAALCAVSAVTLLSVLGSTKKHEYYYFLVLDGMLILQFVVVCLARVV